MGSTSVDSSSSQTYLPASYFDKQGNLTVSASTAQAVASAVQTDAASLPPADAAIFLQMVGASTDLTPTGNGGVPANLDVTLSHYENAAREVESFDQLGKMSDELATVLVQQAQSQQQQAMRNRLNALQLSVAYSTDAANQDTAGAQALQAGATESLFLSCAAAAVQVVGAGLQIGAAGAALKGLSGLASEADEAGEAGAGNMDIVSEVPSLNGSEDMEVEGSSSSLVESSSSSSSDDSADMSLDGDGDSAGEDEDLDLNLDADTKGFSKQLDLQLINRQAEETQGYGQIFGALGTVFNAAAQYVTANAQAQNQIYQARGQLDQAQATQQQAVVTAQDGIGSSCSAFVNAALGLINELRSVIVGEDSAVASMKV